MPIQTLSLNNLHPPLISLSKLTKTATIFTFKTHHKTSKRSSNSYRKLRVFAVKGEEEQPTPSWAKPGSEEPPPWARNEAQQTDSASVDLPFFVYLLASAITAIAAIGSVFEYVNQKPVFGVLNSDSIFYTPVLGFFAITGLPTAVSLFLLVLDFAYLYNYSSVRSFFRRFNPPLKYKSFVSKCTVHRDLNTGSVREVNVKSDLLLTILGTRYKFYI